jgi:hypothetical protein
MDLSKINTSTLESLIKLTRRRDALLDDLKKLEAQMSSIYSGGRAETTVRRRRSTGRRRYATATAGTKRARRSEARDGGRRGALKAKILTALRAAGDKGVAVRDLSSKLGVKNQNVHVWFSSTGKKIPDIQRIGAGRYRLRSAA